MVFSSNVGQQGDKVKLMSKLFKSAVTKVVRFGYYMEQTVDVTPSSLDVFQTSEYFVQGPQLFHASTDTNGSWVDSGPICLSPGSYYLTFVATQGQQYSSLIAIDNIVFMADSEARRICVGQNQQQGGVMILHNNY